MRSHTFLACRVTVDTLSQIVLIVICEVVPSKELTIAAFWNLACSSNEEIPKLGNNSDLVWSFKVSASGALGRERPATLSACGVARVAIVVLVVTPETVRTELI